MILIRHFNTSIDIGFAHHHMYIQIKIMCKQEILADSIEIKQLF